MLTYMTLSTVFLIIYFILRDVLIDICKKQSSLFIKLKKLKVGQATIACLDMINALLDKLGIKDILDATVILTILAGLFFIISIPTIIVLLYVEVLILFFQVSEPDINDITNKPWGNYQIDKNYKFDMNKYVPTQSEYNNGIYTYTEKYYLRTKSKYRRNFISRRKKRL